MTRKDLIAYLESRMSDEMFLEKYIAHRGYGTKRLPFEVVFMLHDRIGYAVDYMARKFGLIVVRDNKGNIIKYL